MSNSVTPPIWRSSVASADELAFGEIARHWSHEPGQKSEDDLLAILAGAMFLDQFRFASERTICAAGNRDFVLRALVDAGGIPESVYVDDDSSHESLARTNVLTSTPVPERALIYRHRDLQIDLNALAAAPIDSYPEIGRKVLRNIAIHREVLRSWCEDHEIEFPKFWRHRGETYLKKAGGRQAIECERWLKEQVDAGNRIGKRKLFDQARGNVSGLTHSQFLSVWETVAPPAWKLPGAIPKRSKTRIESKRISRATD